MRVIARSALRDFWQKAGHADAKQPILVWYKEARQASWNGPADIKAQQGNASFLKGNRVVFNIAGNKYRLIVRINYAYKVLYVRFIGTHAAYDKINAAEV